MIHHVILSPQPGDEIAIHLRNNGEIPFLQIAPTGASDLQGLTVNLGSMDNLRLLWDAIDKALNTKLEQSFRFRR